MSLSSFEVRDYQIRLFQVCIRKNSILYLPTGSGKTLIAVKVIDHFSDDLNIEVSRGGKRSLFLVNTVCLGKQVAEEIKNLLGLKVACWDSDTRKTSWSKQRYYDEFNNTQVIVATAQLFLDAVKHAYISIDQLNVIVFDECHHGRMNHPYHELMKQFKFVPVEKQPRIIGLSGMLIGISSSITVKTVEEELAALESTFLSTIVTVNRLQEFRNVLLYATNPKEKCLKYVKTEPCNLTKSLLEKVESIRWDISLINIDSLFTINPQTLRQGKHKKLKELSLLFEDFKYELEEMGIYGGYLSLQAIRIQFELVKKQANQHQKILEVVNLCLKYVKELNDMIEEEVDFKNDVTAEKIIINSSQKVRTLIGILIQKFTEDKNNVEEDNNNVEEDKGPLQSLVFVKRRFTAKCLYHLFKRYAELEPSFPVKPDFVVGVNSELPESIDDVLSLSMNKFALDKFRKKVTNCIFASSVLEEGMDLQSCNLVVMYDFPATFRSYVQTKGRARSKTSNYIVLLPKTNVHFFYKRDEYDAIDKKLKHLLISNNTIDRELSDDGIEQERLEIWEPFVTERQALVNNISSVALLNRYVSRFTNANTLFERRDIGPGKYIAIVKLPPQSGISHPIESDVFDDIKLSKQNAAFKACKELHEIGKLDDNLMPKYV